MDKITFQLDNKIIDVYLLWTKNKNLYLKINKENQIQVSAPEGVDIKLIKNFVNKNLQKFSDYLVERVQKKRIF